MIPVSFGDLDGWLHLELAELASDGILHYQPFLPTPAVVVCMYRGVSSFPKPGVKG